MSRPHQYVIPKNAKPLGLSNEEVVGRMLRRTLDGKSGTVETVSSWGSPSREERSDLDGDRMRLRDEHAKPLVDAGLLYRTESGSIHYGLTPAGIRLASQVIGRVPLDVKALLEHTLDTVLFGPSDAIDGRTAIPALYDPSTSGSKLVLVLGENAAGKSLFRRVINGVTHRGREARGMGEPAVPRGPFPVGEMIHLSMQGRAGGGFMSSMVYGEESYHSTGENSAHTIDGAIRTASGRDHTTIVYWDEPDIGMSAGAAAGAGEAIREFVAQDEAPLIEAVFITSHSPALVRQLVPLGPHYVFLGNADGPKTLADWFAWQQNPPPISPRALQDLSHARFRDIQAVLNAAGKG